MLDYDDSAGEARFVGELPSRWDASSEAHHMRGADRS